MAASVIRFEAQTVIRRPASEVFERLADLPGYRQWMHRDGVFGGTEATSALPVRSGTTYVDRTRMGRFVGEVTEHVPSTRLAFSETFSIFGRSLTQARPSLRARGRRRLHGRPPRRRGGGSTASLACSGRSPRGW